MLKSTSRELDDEIVVSSRQICFGLNHVGAFFGLSQVGFAFRQSCFRREHPGLILTLLNLEKELSFLDHRSFGKENLFKHALRPRANLNSLAGRSLAYEFAVDRHGLLLDVGHYYGWRRWSACFVGGVFGGIVSAATCANQDCGGGYQRRYERPNLATVLNVHR